jgi:protein gp37
MILRQVVILTSLSWAVVSVSGLETRSLSEKWIHTVRNVEKLAALTAVFFIAFRRSINLLYPNNSKSLHIYSAPI